MGWYHYQCTEDGNCDVNQPVPCPDGTCKPDGNDNNCTSSGEVAQTSSTASSDDKQEEPEELYHATAPIFHLCQKKHWLKAIQAKEPYFPPTFWKDGRFTRASCEAVSLPQTANHYYQQIKGDWLCLEIDPTLLRQMGMPIVAQRAPESSIDDPVECLKVYGGIPTVHANVILEVYAMQRETNGRFYGMKPDSSVAKVAVLRPQQKQETLTEKLAQKMHAERIEKVKAAQKEQREKLKIASSKSKEHQPKNAEQKQPEQPKHKEEHRRRFWKLGKK